MRRSHSETPADVKVIPGHGAVANVDDVRAYIKMLKDTLAVVQKGVQEGKTLDQLKREKVLEPWKKWNGDFVTTDMFVETLYNDLTGKKDEKLIKHN
jgi:cyclase